MDVCHLVGHNLRRLRIARGLSQEAVGERARLEPTYISRVERGRENVTVQTLAKLALVFDEHVSALLAPVDANSVELVTLRPGPKARAEKVARAD